MIKAGYEPIVIDNGCNSSKECAKRIEQITGSSLISYTVDCLNLDALREIFRKHSIHAIIHCAAVKSVAQSVEKPIFYYRNNVGCLLNLLMCMEEFNVKNFVFSSSATVYGAPQYLPLDEKHPCVGDTIANPYGKSKYMCEHVLKDAVKAHSDWNVIILRYFNPVGAHESGLIGEDPVGRPNNLMPFIAQVAVGRFSHVNVMGTDYETPDGTGVRDYIHVVDLAVGHIAAMKKLDENCGLQVYNLGTGKGYSVFQMIKEFEKASGKKINYQTCPRRPGDLASLYADPSLAVKELGWIPERDLDDMCKDVWRWQSTNPNGFGSLSV